MNGAKQGHSLPLAPNRSAAVWLAVLYPLMMFAFALLENWEMTRKGWDDSTRLGMLVYLAILVLIGYLVVLYNCFAKLHIASDGISVTIFGFHVRRVPAERIRFITGIHYRRRAEEAKLIAVCDHTLTELTELAVAGKPQMLRNSRELWPGEWAGEYLRRLAGRIFRLNKKIVWLQWDASRVKILQEMYPWAQWLDCTQKKIFDEQLRY